MNQVHERKGGMIRVCHAFILILGLHCLTSLLAGAWPQQDGSIIKAVLHPELSFWQGFLPNNPGGSHANHAAFYTGDPHPVPAELHKIVCLRLFVFAGSSCAPSSPGLSKPGEFYWRTYSFSFGAFPAAARRRDSENETAGESHAQKFVHGHPWHASNTKGEAAKRELESVNKRAANEELVSLQVHLRCLCMCHDFLNASGGILRLSDALCLQRHTTESCCCTAISMQEWKGSAWLGCQRCNVQICCPSQEQKEQPAVQVEAQASQGVLASFLSFLWEDKVTWADRLAEHLNSQNLDAWEERQLAQYEITQSTIR